MDETPSTRELEGLAGLPHEQVHRLPPPVAISSDRVAGVRGHIRADAAASAETDERAVSRRAAAGAREPRIGNDRRPTDVDARETTALLLSPDEIARACRLSVKSVYRAIGSGELAATRICNRLRVRPADLHVWIEKSRLEQKRERARPTPARVTHSSVAGLRAMLRAESGKDAL